MNKRMWGAALAAALSAVAAQAQERLPASAFARLPAIEAAEISPDGSRIAHLEHSADGDFLVIRSVPDFTPLTGVNTTSSKARDVLWADDNHVILIASEAAPVFGVRGQVEFTAPFSVNLAEGGKVLPLMQTGRAARTGSRIGTEVSRTRINPNRARVVGRNPATGHLLIPDLDGEDFDLFSVDPSSDRRRSVGSGTQNTRDWVVNENGEPIVRVDYRDLSNRFRIVARRGGRDWETVIEETTDIPSLDVYGLAPGGELIIGTRPANVGRYGLYVLSLETGQIERPYLVDEQHDVGGVAQDPYTNRIVGAVVHKEDPKMVWFDQDLARHQQAVDAALGGVPSMILSWSRDRSRFIVLAEHGELPPVYYLYDAGAGTLKAITSAYPEVLAAGIAPRLSILYPARDGVQIPAYLTMADGLPQPAPLVVLPHGGPEARDVGGFDWLAHFLASRGYVVLQPNFRGSDGYGAAWRDAGRGGWGTGVMQHDVTDGVQLLIEEGIADPNRVCIVGASYGGYAALAGAALTPDLYRCAAAIAPVSDLNDMIAYERDRAGPGSWIVSYWQDVIGGDLGAARSRLSAMSPARHADAVQAPVLLIHGRDDTVVPISQSREMERALRAAGKSVELIELSGEDHWLSRAATRLQTLEALDAFLATHLGG